MKFEVMYKLKSFKLVDGKPKAVTLVGVRFEDGRVVTVYVPKPEYLVTNEDIEKALRSKGLI